MTHVSLHTVLQAVIFVVWKKTIPRFW